MPLTSVAWIDTHAHIFDHTCAFVPQARYTPDYRVSVDDYLGELTRAHIRCAVLVQPSFLGADNSLMERAIAGTAARETAAVALRGVAVVGGGDWGAELARLAEAGFDGVRLNLIGGHVPDFAEKPGRQFLRACADLKLHVEIQAEGSRWAQILPAIAGAGVRVVIDHLGRIGTLDVMASPGFRAILDALRHTDAWVKCSAPFRSPPGVAAAALRVLLDQAGPHRLVWGSDYPWTQHENGWNFVSSQRWLADAVHDREALAAIAGGNALTLFRFGQMTEQGGLRPHPPGGLRPHPPGGLRPHPPRATGPWNPGLSGRGRQGGGQ